MKSKYLIGALAIAGAAFSLPASAQLSMPSLSSAYIGASLGQAEHKLDCEGFPCDEKDNAWRVFGGFQLNRTFSVELGYANLGESTVDFGAGDTFHAEVTAWDLSAIGAIPVGPVSLFGRLGLYRATVEVREPLLGLSSDDSNTGFVWGLGVMFDINKNLGIRAEWQQYNDVGSDDIGEADVRVLNVGLLWRFQ